MDSSPLAEKLFRENLISESSFQKIKTADSDKMFSLNFELKSMLYAGVLLLAGGLGIAIYKNIDAIGHMAVILFIAAVSAACFIYCYRKRTPFAIEKVNSPNIFFDYVLLLGCLTFLSFLAYLQFQYAVFGTHHGISVLVPALLFFFAAYFFDHLGVLSMAITCLAAFLGIAIAPASVLSGNDLSGSGFIFTALILGASLIVAGNRLQQQKIKSHFTLTYLNFGMHLMYIGCLQGLFWLDSMFIFILLLAALIYGTIRYALRTGSFYFLLIAAIYGYIGFTYVFMHFLSVVFEFAGLLFIGPLYFISSAVLMIVQLRKYKRKIKSHAGLS